jgi:hypothetical protein
MKIIALEESADFATLDTEKLFSKLKSHELSRKGCPNYDAFLSSKALITGAHVGGHVANPTNTTDSFALKFVLSSLCAASDEQYETISDDEIALLMRKFRALHIFRKERRKSPRGCFECGNTTQEEEARLLLQQVRLHQVKQLQQGQRQEEVSVRRQQEEEVLEDDVPSVCSSQ